MEEVVLEGDRVQSKQQLCLCLLQDVCLTIKQQKQRAAGRVHGIFTTLTFSPQHHSSEFKTGPDQDRNTTSYK